MAPCGQRETRLSERRNRSDEDVREALALYLRTPFGRIHSRNPDILSLADRLGRTPGAVALKLTNLAALDDSLPRKGMANASATDRRVWAEFLNDPAPVEQAYDRQTSRAGRLLELAEDPAAFAHVGQTLPARGTRRVGQGLFRDMILANYGFRCALSGVDDPRLLTASHIVPWSAAPEHRVQPTNGICLNALHDRAFDRHLIAFGLLVSPRLSPATRARLTEGTSPGLALPDRFRPDPGLLTAHRARFEATP
jgi:putative restriction endonuclease